MDGNLWKLMAITLGLLLAENIQNLTFGESGEREKRADSMHCIEEIAPFQH